MNNAESVTRALERQALSAPDPDGLLERVRDRGRRRRRRRIATTAGLLAVLAGAAVLGSPLLGGTEPSPAAAALGTGDVTVCFRLDGGASAEVTVVERIGDDTVDVESGSGAAVRMPVDADLAGLVLEVSPGPLSEVAPDGLSEVGLDGAAAREGIDDGHRLLLFDTGVAGTVVRITADPGVSPDVLRDWGRQIGVSTDPEDCRA